MKYCWYKSEPWHLIGQSIFEHAQLKIHIPSFKFLESISACQKLSCEVFTDFIVFKQKFYCEFLHIGGGGVGTSQIGHFFVDAINVRTQTVITNFLEKLKKLLFLAILGPSLDKTNFSKNSTLSLFRFYKYLSSNENPEKTFFNTDAAIYLHIWSITRFTLRKMN